MGILDFLGSPAGRWARMILGAALILLGTLTGGWALVLAGIGAVFVLAGALDVCLLGPLVGRPMNGKAFRAAKRAG